MTATGAHTTTCKRCGRPLTSRKSVATRYGATCLRRERAEGNGAYSPEQAAKAFRLVQGGGVRRVPSRYFHMYEVQGAGGVYQSDGLDCTCRGAREHGGCWHVLAVRLSLAA